jgi:hypothetical protein
LFGIPERTWISTLGLGRVHLVFQDVMTMHHDRRTDPSASIWPLFVRRQQGIDAAALRAGILQRAIGQRESRNDL